ncbi:hypothetical protein [Mycolicibacterium sediminis]|nr:hypothetical protein [Mycolicibacterium sediminis]
MEPSQEADPADVAEQARETAERPDGGVTAVDEPALESDPADYVEQHQSIVGDEDDDDRRRY